MYNVFILLKIYLEIQALDVAEQSNKRTPDCFATSSSCGFSFYSQLRLQMP